MIVFKRWITVACLAVVCLLVACTSSATIAGEPRTWIDVPINDLVVAPGQPVQIEGHAAHTAGVDSIEFWFNGELQTTQDNPTVEGDSVSAFIHLKEALVSVITHANVLLPNVERLAA